MYTYRIYLERDCEVYMKTIKADSPEEAKHKVTSLHSGIIVEVTEV